MSKLKLYLVIALLVVLAYVLLKKPAPPVTTSSSRSDNNDPYKTAEDTLKKLTDMVAQKFPQLQQSTSTAQQEAQQLVNKVDQIAAEIQQQFQKEAPPILISDYAVPQTSTPTPSSVFESINSEPEQIIVTPITTVKQIYSEPQVIETVQTLVSPYVAPIPYVEPQTLLEPIEINTYLTSRERFIREYQQPAEV